MSTEKKMSKYKEMSLLPIQTEFSGVNVPKDVQTKTYPFSLLPPKSEPDITYVVSTDNTGNTLELDDLFDLFIKQKLLPDAGYIMSMSGAYQGTGDFLLNYAGAGPSFYYCFTVDDEGEQLISGNFLNFGFDDTTAGSIQSIPGQPPFTLKFYFVTDDPLWDLRYPKVLPGPLASGNVIMDVSLTIFNQALAPSFFVIQTIDKEADTTEVVGFEFPNDQGTNETKTPLKQMGNALADFSLFMLLWSTTFIGPVSPTNGNLTVFYYA